MQCDGRDWTGSDMYIAGGNGNDEHKQVDFESDGSDQDEYSQEETHDYHDCGMCNGSSNDHGSDKATRMPVAMMTVIMKSTIKVLAMVVLMTIKAMPEPDDYEGDGSGDLSFFSLDTWMTTPHEIFDIVFKFMLHWMHRL
eukprot:4391661-Lingulodinium_polyedra.AAC.1